MSRPSSAKIDNSTGNPAGCPWCHRIVNADTIAAGLSAFNIMTLVPRDEPLQAEVWVSTEDIGFVRPKQPVKLKLSAFTFQKYGMVDGTVDQVSADASENQGQAKMGEQGIVPTSKTSTQLHYRTLVSLSNQQLMTDGKKHKLTPGMQVTAEIKLGTRSVLEYFFSPVSKAFQEAGRER